MLQWPSWPVREVALASVALPSNRSGPARTPPYGDRQITCQTQKKERLRQTDLCLRCLPNRPPKHLKTWFGRRGPGHDQAGRFRGKARRNCSGRRLSECAEHVMVMKPPESRFPTVHRGRNPPDADPVHPLQIVATSNRQISRWAAPIQILRLQLPYRELANDRRGQE